MKTLVAERNGSIYYNGKRLDVIVEYYRTIVKVYFLDKSKYFPTLDVVKFKRNSSLDVLLRARQYAIDNNLFNY